jgi:PAS domain-containing protein
MRRFILQANIDRYQSLLGQEWDPRSRDFLRRSLAAARREFAVLDASVAGVRQGPTPGRAGRERAGQLRREFERTFVDSPRGVLLLEPGPGLHIVDASRSYAQAALIDRHRVRGQHMFDVFPDNPEDPLADGVSNLHRSLRKAAASGTADVMPVQRYDVRTPSGIFVERYWRLSNTPVFDDDGRLIYILHEAEDVTSEMAGRQSGWVGLDAHLMGRAQQPAHDRAALAG